MWRLLAGAVKDGSPVLLTGSDGCGKSSALNALARLLSATVLQYTMTPETPPCDLVGQFAPNDQPGGSRIIWTDGVATQALKSGNWLLLRHLEAADAKVLERLNPLLEADPMWVLTEKGETKPVQPADTAAGSFQLLATLTPPSRLGSSEVL